MSSFTPGKHIIFLFFLVILLAQMGGCLVVETSGSETFDFDDLTFTPDTIPETPEIPDDIFGYGSDEDILYEGYVASYFFIYYIFAQDGQFLGFVNDKFYDDTSLCNIFGPYGSEISSTSIFYYFGKYGSDYSDYSAFDDFASNPPILYEDDVAVAYVSTNYYFYPRVDPYYLMYLLNSLWCDVSR